jgi:hypothetical protein
MTQEDQVFVTDVVVVDPMWKMMALSVISQLACVVTKLSAITKIRKYKEGFMRGTTLFQWSRRCTMHPIVMWIVSSWAYLVNVLVLHLSML